MMLPELARALTLLWPPTFSPFLFLSLSAAPRGGPGFFSVLRAGFSHSHFSSCICFGCHLFGNNVNILGVHISLRVTLFTFKTCFSVSLPSVCNGSEKLSGVSASPVQAWHRQLGLQLHSHAQRCAGSSQVCRCTGK